MLQYFELSTLTKVKFWELKIMYKFSGFSILKSRFYLDHLDKNFNCFSRWRMVYAIQELIFLNVFSMGVIALVGILLVPIYLKFYLDYILFQKLRSESSSYFFSVVAWYCIVARPLDIFISQAVTDWIKISSRNDNTLPYQICNQMIST